jgi:hypothetical protein
MLWDAVGMGIAAMEFDIALLSATKPPPLLA